MDAHGRGFSMFVQNVDIRAGQGLAQRNVSHLNGKFACCRANSRLCWPVMVEDATIRKRPDLCNKFR